MVQILGNKPFAFLLCNFTDSLNPTPFTVAEARSGLSTISRFWTETSYSKVTLNDSIVMDWITLPLKNSDFIATYKTKTAMIQYAKDHSAIDPSKYVGFIVIFSEPVGTAWTEGNGAVFEPTIVRSALICHEMTHILGELRHSWDFSSRKVDDWSPPGQYFDQVDIMSAANCWSTDADTAHPFVGDGPLHCMVWKDEFGWLETTKALRISTEDLEHPYNLNMDVQQRQRDLTQGDHGLRPFNIFFRDISIEFCVATGFDAGLDGSGVVIHQIVDGVPWVLVPDVTTAPDQKFWGQGAVCVREAVGRDAGDDYWIWIREINAAAGYAKVNVTNGVVPPFARVQIRAIRKAYTSSLRRQEYIDAVGIADGNGGLAVLPRSTVVDWIEVGRNTFFVRGADGSTADVVVEGHWIKTVPDESTANNLYSLPTF